jgi:hypothetical protein
MKKLSHSVIDDRYFGVYKITPVSIWLVCAVDFVSTAKIGHAPPPSKINPIHQHPSLIFFKVFVIDIPTPPSSPARSLNNYLCQ